MTQTKITQVDNAFGPMTMTLTRKDQSFTWSLGDRMSDGFRQLSIEYMIELADTLARDAKGIRTWLALLEQYGALEQGNMNRMQDAAEQLKEAEWAAEIAKKALSKMAEAAQPK